MDFDCKFQRDFQHLAGRFRVHSGFRVNSIFRRTGYEPRPAFERGDGEQRQHSLRHVVEVEVAVLPLAQHHHRVVDVAALVHDVLTAAHDLYNVSQKTPLPPFNF